MDCSEKEDRGEEECEDNGDDNIEKADLGMGKGRFNTY